MITGITVKHKDESQVAPVEDSWRMSLASAVRDPKILLKMLDLSWEEYQEKVYFPDKFKLFVPRSYVHKMKRGDWQDPLLRQVLPLTNELRAIPGFSEDPVGDLKAELTSGVLQKYQGRVLLVTTGACAVHCRYCFRRHFPYAQSSPDKHAWDNTLATIKADNSITEVILSGGDPFMLSDARLQTMCEQLSAIPQIKTLRFHTRIPVFMPERMTEKFITWMDSLAVQKVIVIHANHANELDADVAQVLHRLNQSNITLLNQSVLLKGVNDSVDTLAHLSERLFEMQVLPYYLHQLDRVSGAAHFEVEEAQARNLMRALRNRLPGYLVPKLVVEISGKRSKQAIV